MSVFLIGLIICVILFALYWVLQYAINNAGIVDVFWGASVAIASVYYCVIGPGLELRRWIVGILITLWAARLSFFLYLRWRSHPEDPRYTALKDQWGKQAQLRMFRFYQMQALGAYLFSLPVLATAFNTSPLGWLDFIGIGIWLVAMIGEGIADQQLANFKKDPNNRGEVCDIGLWRYSRHPNYFFEWLHWWTYVPIAIMVPFGWLTIVAPIAMWFFLNRVTGIPHTERQAIKSRGEKYRRYQQTTSPFFPWFPAQQTLQND